MKNEKGITLLVLIITIIVMVILAGVTISALIGEDGVIDRAKKAAEQQKYAIAKEKILVQVEYDENGKVNLSKAKDNIAALNLQEIDITKGEDNTGCKLTNEQLLIYLKNGEIIIINANGKIAQERPIQTNNSYIGYYADIEADGIVDGVIYADLLIGGEGRWKNTNSDTGYKYNKINSAKDYYISKESHTDDFGTKPVLSPNGEGNERFYIMSLDDFKATVDGTEKSTFCWYAAGYNTSANYSICTGTEFGTGKDNTAKMIEKWTNKKYGNQHKSDIWGALETKAVQGWFLPSKMEFNAFLGELEINKNNSCNLTDSSYWSSSQLGSWESGHLKYAYCFGYETYWSGGFINYDRYVRLSTTF